jgi:cellulase/cellobiase CelA1
VPPTTSTGAATVDAFVWAKPPGEADGCAAAAGTFTPDLVYQLAMRPGRDLPSRLSGDTLQRAGVH